MTVTRDAGNGPVVIFSSTDVTDATISVNFDDFGVGVYEILVVATDGDEDWPGDGTLNSSEVYFDHQVLDTTGWRRFGRLFDQGVNVDGAHVLEDGRILLSVSSTATVGDDGPNFKDGDVFVYDPDADTAELLFDEDSFRRDEEVDAVFLGIGNGELKLFDELF